MPCAPGAPAQRAGVMGEQSSARHTDGSSGRLAMQLRQGDPPFFPSPALEQEEDQRAVTRKT